MPYKSFVHTTYQGLIKVSPFPLQTGKSLPCVELAYTTHGELNVQRNNVIWVCHALTANANPLDWWSGLFSGQDKIDLEQYFIVCVNMLASCYGNTNPNSINPSTGYAYGLDFPIVSIRDMAKGLEIVREKLQLDEIQYLIGGSMGGMQALEWAYLHPQRIKNLVLLATNAKHSPWGIALNEAQRMAIEADASFFEKTTEGGKKGMAAARAMALTSYRSYHAYGQTQYEESNHYDGYKAASYQQYQGQKLCKRFDAKSYWYLSKAMDSHDVGRHRGGCEAALQRITAKTLVIGIENDGLFPVEEQAFLAQHIPHAKLEVISSNYGHDGFLIETEKIKTILQNYYNL